jgi:hypothetical protein
MTWLNANAPSIQAIAATASLLVTIILSEPTSRTLDLGLSAECSSRRRPVPLLANGRDPIPNPEAGVSYG